MEKAFKLAGYKVHSVTGSIGYDMLIEKNNNMYGIEFKNLHQYNIHFEDLERYIRRINSYAIENIIPVLLIDSSRAINEAKNQIAKTTNVKIIDVDGLKLLLGNDHIDILNN